MDQNATNKRIGDIIHGLTGVKPTKVVLTFEVKREPMILIEGFTSSQLKTEIRDTLEAIFNRKIEEDN